MAMGPRRMYGDPDCRHNIWTHGGICNPCLAKKYGEVVHLVSRDGAMPARCGGRVQYGAFDPKDVTCPECKALVAKEAA